MGDQGTTPGTVRAAAKRQGWSKIARRTTAYKFINQCCNFVQTAVVDHSQWSGLRMGVT